MASHELKVLLIFLIPIIMVYIKEKMVERDKNRVKKNYKISNNFWVNCFIGISILMTFFNYFGWNQYFRQARLTDDSNYELKNSYFNFLTISNNKLFL